jgi:hypothetical protein
MNWIFDIAYVRVRCDVWNVDAGCAVPKAWTEAVPVKGQVDLEGTHAITFESDELLVTELPVPEGDWSGVVVEYLDEDRDIICDQFVLHAHGGETISLYRGC